MRDVNNNRGEAAKIQSNLSSGKVVRVPSHSPVDFQRARITEENIRKEEQFQNNIDSGLRQGRLAQDILDKAIDSLIEVKEIAINGASESFGDTSRKSMADQIAGIKDTLITSLNLTYGDRYLFAGTNSDQPPYEKDEVTGDVINNSNSKAPIVKVGDGVNIEFSITGQEIAATSEGDLFQIFTDLEQALRDNDVEAVNNSLDPVEGAIDHITDLASKLGNNINRMDFMFEQYENSKITQESNISEMVDTDYAQAFSDMQRNQVAYESAMAVHSTMFKNTLLDYL